jgi:UDP-3-O-[3-hydroxymyristoyl] glucosamine N-acyltransferase
MGKKKYELIPSDKEGLYRIKALHNFSDVEKGEIGGYVSSEDNLSHDGDCWIYGDAIVRDNARVCSNAKVSGNAEVRDNAVVCENAWVHGSANVYGNARVCSNARVFCGAEVCDDAWVHGSATIDGYAVVRCDAEVHDNAYVYGNAIVSGTATIGGNAEICGYAVIAKKIGDYMTFQDTWSSGRYFTWTRSNNMWRVGCFYGTDEELIKKAYTESEESGKMYELYVNLVKEVLKVSDSFAESK